MVYLWLSKWPFSNTLRWLYTAKHKQAHCKWVKAGCYIWKGPWPARAQNFANEILLHVCSNSSKVAPYRAHQLMNDSHSFVQSRFLSNKSDVCVFCWCGNLSCWYSFFVNILRVEPEVRVTKFIPPTQFCCWVTFAQLRSSVVRPNIFPLWEAKDVSSFLRSLKFCWCEKLQSKVLTERPSAVVVIIFGAQKEKLETSGFRPCNLKRCLANKQHKTEGHLMGCIRQPQCFKFIFFFSQGNNKQAKVHSVLLHTGENTCKLESKVIP